MRRDLERIAPITQPVISFAVSPQAFQMIQHLLGTGMYGRSRAAVCREFVYKCLREMIVIDRQRESLSRERPRAQRRK